MCYIIETTNGGQKGSSWKTITQNQWKKQLMLL